MIAAAAVLTRSKQANLAEWQQTPVGVLAGLARRSVGKDATTFTRQVRHRRSR